MRKLAYIELKKIITYPTFWILLGMYAVLLFFITFGLHQIKFNNSPLALFSLQTYYTFPYMWHTVTYLASFFNLLLGTLIIILITNEFTFRTNRQNIIDGLSKAEFLVAKLILIVCITVVATLFVSIIGLISGISQTPNLNASLIFDKIAFLLAYFVQAIAYMCFALFIGTLVKKSGLAIGLFLVYSKIVEPLICLKLPSGISDYMPFNIMSNLIQNPALKVFGMSVNESPLGIHFVFTIVYSCIFIAGTHLLLTKRDL
jgi:ABC-type transport system involved in multi-copper enzyme maturation permease subunit